MEKKQIETREALAFNILAMDSDAGLQNPTLLSDWRNNPDMRQRSREIVDRLTANLAEVGLRVTVASTPKLEKFLDDLTTIPATRAYAIEKETPEGPPPLDASQG